MTVSRSSLLAGAAALVVLGAMFAASRSTQRAEERRAPNATTPGSTGGAADGESSTTTAPARQDWRFVDSSADAGLADATAATDAIHERAMAAALGLGDFNGDGRIDVVAGRIGQPNLLLEADGPAHYAIVPEAGGASGPTSGTGAFAVGDVDADGDLDLFTASLGPEPDLMYLNDGTGRFSDGTAAVGLPTASTPAQSSEALRLGATMHDWDTDGDLDLLVAHWDPNVYPKEAIEKLGRHPGGGVCETTAKIRELGIGRSASAPPNLSRMYRNDGGRFVDVTTESGVDFGGVVAFTPMFRDLDGDGLDDLLVTGDGCTSRVFRNGGDGTFSDVTAQLGVGIDENGMGSVVTDLDHDGLDDWFVTAIAYPGDDATCAGPGLFSGCHGNAAYLRQPDGTYKDEAKRLGIRDGAWGWGVVAADLDNSGQVDLVMTNGYESGIVEAAPGQDTAETRYFLSFKDDPMKLWTWEESAYRDVAGPTGLLATEAGTSQGRGLAAVDVDGDGDLDLFVNSVNNGVSLLENRLSGPNRWLEVVLDDPVTPGNRSGIGATVTLDLDGRSMKASVRTDGSYGTVAAPIVHFGLGASDPSRSTSGSIDASLTIEWPDGKNQVVPIDELDQRIEVTRAG